MEKKKNFTELLGAILAYTGIIGVMVMILSSAINLLFFKGANQILGHIGLIGAAAFVLPLLILQFVMTSGLLDRLGFQVDLSFWVKLVIYLIVFPFVDMWVVSVANAAFHFLPTFREAVAWGMQITREQLLLQNRAAVGIAYVSIISVGLIFRAIFSNKLKLKIA